MKLMTNFFQSKKPSLEEGPMIYTVSDEYSVNNRTERSKICKLCLQFMKVIFYVLLLLFVLFVVWGLFVFATYSLGWGEEPLRCGVTDDAFDPRSFDNFSFDPRSYDPIYNDSGNEFNPTEVDDMTDNVAKTIKTINYADDYMEMTTSASHSADSTTYENFYSYEEKR